MGIHGGTSGPPPPCLGKRPGPWLFCCCKFIMHNDELCLQIHEFAYVMETAQVHSAAKLKEQKLTRSRQEHTWTAEAECQGISQAGYHLFAEAGKHVIRARACTNPC